MGGDFFSNLWKGGDFVNEFGKPWSKESLNLKLLVYQFVFICQGDGSKLHQGSILHKLQLWTEDHFVR